MISLRKYITILILSIAVLPLSGQEVLKTGGKIVSDLSSEEFHGRGYVNKGEQKAANYISDYFSRFELNSFDGSYFQEFNIEVNRFPDSVRLSVDGVTLKTGVDFQVHPTSGPANGIFDALHINKDNFLDLSIYKQLYSPEGVDKTKILILDPDGISNKDTLVEFQGLKFSLAKDFPVIYLVDDKLTWGVANRQHDNAILEVNRESISGGIEKVSLNVNAELVEEYSTQNVIGYIEGKKKKKKYVVVTAHYDHLGQMGSTAYIPGANDNASGVAMMLTLVQHFAENPPDFSVVFIAFGAEEVGLLGSKHYVDNPLFPLKKIKFLLNLDLLGTGSEGIKVVNATKHKESFDRLQKINEENDYVAKVAPRGEAANSDHYFFSKAGVPAFFIYTLGGPPHYHDVNDKAETLPLTEFEDLHEMFVEFLVGFME